MKDIYIVSDSVVSPLGWTTAANFSALLAGRTGVRRHERPDLSAVPFQAALFDDAALNERFGALPNAGTPWSRFEKMALLAVSDALAQTTVRLDDPETLFILSTTKGNIALLEAGDPARPDLLLSHTARKIATHFRHPNTPLVVAHACISGVAALLLAQRLLKTGPYRHAVLAGADEVSRFVLSGFQSFQALSDEGCRPFDSRRKGLNLGEGCGAAVLSVAPETALGRAPIRVLAGAISNDANHISGPSRTGAELSQAIDRTLRSAGLSPTDLGFISAHGTATPYNDEMEAKAFDLSDLNAVPLNSLKGYFGHTLGAAGLIEAVLSAQSLRENTVLPTLGFETLGVPRPVTVCAQALPQPMQFCLKTASGFGGCNAAVALGK